MTQRVHRSWVIMLLAPLIITGCISSHGRRSMPRRAAPSLFDGGLPLPVRVEDHCMVDTTRQMPENAEWLNIWSDKIYYRDPVPVLQIMPPGSADSKGSARRGAVMVKAFIDSTGKVIYACIITSTASPSFETASLRAAMQWTFIPAQDYSGHPLGCWVTIPFRTNIK